MMRKKYQTILDELSAVIEEKNMTIKVQRETIKDLQRALYRAEYHLNPLGKIHPDLETRNGGSCNE